MIRAIEMGFGKHRRVDCALKRDQRRIRPNTPVHVCDVRIANRLQYLETVEPQGSKFLLECFECREKPARLLFFRRGNSNNGDVCFARKVRVTQSKNVRLAGT